MARTSQMRGRGGRAPRMAKKAMPIKTTKTGKDWDAIDAAKQEMKRRERILEDRRRTDAKWRPKIPEVRRVANFEAFKNHFHDLEEQDYAVEALYALPELQAQIRREQTTRRKEENAKSRNDWAGFLWSGGVGPSEYGDGPSYTSSKKIVGSDKPRFDDNIEENDPVLQGARLQRIRIQSQAVLGHLTSLMGETERRSTPRTFVRPFKPIIYYQPRMKAILAELEEKWADVEGFEDAQSEVSTTPEEIEIVKEVSVKSEAEGEESGEDGEKDEDAESMRSVDSNAEDQELLMDGVEALRDMRCYVEFVDREVMPVYTQFDGTTAQNVHFEDLWCLFRTGDLIYMPSENGNGNANAQRYHEMWRIHSVQVPEPDVSYPKQGLAWLDGFGFEDDNNSDDHKFLIRAYYIDHDGVEFGAVRHIFKIDAFPGERPIESLELFPVRFAENHQQLLSTLQNTGRDFVKNLQDQDRHQSYNAWTLTCNPPHDIYDYDDPDVDVLRDENGNYWRHPDYVESDVIIDMHEAYQRNSDWRPSFHRPVINVAIQSRVHDDEMPIQQWLTGSRAEKAYSQVEIIQMTDGVEKRQRRENLELDHFLRQRTRGSTRTARETVHKKTQLRDEDLVLLPKRMFAYILRERRFVPIDITSLKPIRREQGVFENLRILKDYKDIVRGLVASHFEKKTVERKYVDRGTEGPSQDLIQGKGRGLVVLLHGVPGVGKTATAEAVAMENKKPLFVVTCGDLGLSPSEVERNLTNMFRLAHIWDCVLLLDEADVFLSQRSKDDMKRNALVSVFLRVLEYYNGILFLTTNRVGHIDDAFKSRIHMSLYYPPLDKSQTRDIFRLNVAKLREIEAQRHEMTGEPKLIVKEADVLDFAARHFEDNARSSGCWNGRQIRNAFQIAASLAHHDYSEKAAAAKGRGERAPAGPVLDGTLFAKVQMSTQSFDRHMSQAKGGDANLALRGSFQAPEPFE